MTSISFDGTALTEYGDPSAPAVVLIHGLGLNQSAWQWQIARFANSHHVITYDLFGHGQSSNPPKTPSLKMFCEQLLRVLDHYKCPSACLVGFSLGGMIVRKFAQDYPNRVDKLVILHSPHRRTDAAQKAILDRVEQARIDGPSATVEAALERWFTAPFRKNNPEMMDLVRGWVMANKTDVYHTIYQVLADGIDEIISPDPAIECPTLVVTGDEDYGNGPEMTRAIAAEIPGAKFIILKGLRHMALGEDPDAISRPTVEFLNSTGA
jgi:pimeloyl-ACP methyl ester carboxylesterase